MFGKLPTYLVGLAMAFGLTSFDAARCQAQAPYYGSNGYGYGYNDPGAGSTPAGSYLTGLGNTIRAQGQYNLLSSEAAINLEEAQKRDIQNRELWTNTYFEMRRINQAYTQAQKKPTPSPDTWVRLAQAAAPAPLPDGALDPVDGAIHWPSALIGDEYRADREKLERLFADRAIMHGAIGVDSYTKIKKATDDMMARLKSHIREMSSSYYLEARTFLESLAHEANYASHEIARR